MSTGKRTRVSPKIVAKARQVLEYAEQRAGAAADWLELSNALFGVGGKATLAFATEAERTAFCKTDEYKRVLALMDRLPTPTVKELISFRPSTP
jgi:hypothetical protein